MTYLALCAIFIGAVLVATLITELASRPKTSAESGVTAPERAVQGAVTPLSAGRWRAVVVTVGVLTALTVVFDSLMIAADLFRYGQLAGPRVWLTPIEDLAWPVAVGVGLPVAWEALRRRRTRPDRAPEVAGDR